MHQYLCICCKLTHAAPMSDRNPVALVLMLPVTAGSEEELVHVWAPYIFIYIFTVYLVYMSLHSVSVRTQCCGFKAKRAVLLHTSRLLCCTS